MITRLDGSKSGSTSSAINHSFGIHATFHTDHHPSVPFNLSLLKTCCSPGLLFGCCHRRIVASAVFALCDCVLMLSLRFYFYCPMSLPRPSLQQRWVVQMCLPSHTCHAPAICSGGHSCPTLPNICVARCILMQNHCSLQIRCTNPASWPRCHGMALHMRPRHSPFGAGYHAPAAA